MLCWRCSGCRCLGVLSNRWELRKPAALAERILQAECLPSEKLEALYGEPQMRTRTHRSCNALIMFLHLYKTFVAGVQQTILR